MPFSAVSIGTNTGASGATLAVTVGAAGVPAGGTIFVLVTEKSTSGTSGTLADTAGNSYSTITAGNLANLAADGRGTLFAVTKCKALVNTNTITYTRNLSAASCAMSAFYVSGATGAATFTEGVATATGTTGTITVTSGALGVGRLVLGALFASGTTTAGGNATFTNAGSFVTPPVQATTGGSGGSRAAGGTGFNPVGGPSSYSPTLSSTAQQWFLAVLGIIPAPTAGVTTDLAPGQLPPRLLDTQTNVQELLQYTLAPQPTGPLRVVFNQYDWPLRFGPEYPNQLRTLTSGPAPVAVIVGPLGIVANQYSWPLTTVDYPVSLRTFTLDLLQTTLFTTPITPPDTTHVLRAPLYTNARAPEYHIQLRTWIGLKPPVLQRPFVQTDWPLPTAPYRLDQSWAWSYNLNLIGQDRLPIRQQAWPLPDAPLYHVQLRSWFGAIPRRAPFAQYDWPNPRGYFYNIDLASITAHYNLNLIGQDQLPVGEHVTDLPPQPQYPNQLRTLTNAPSPAAPVVVVVGPLGVVANQYSWPLPTAPYRIDQTWTWQYNQNLIGQDQFPVGGNLTGGQNDAYGIPWRAEYPIQLRTQTSGPSPAAVVVPTGPLGVVLNQYDWPLFTAARQPAQSWTWQYNSNLIGKDQLPAGDNITDLPPQPQLRALDLRTWLQTVNLALIAPQRPFVQTDWPLTPAAQQPAPSWTASYNRNLVGQDRLPNRQQDWPVPTAAQRALQTWIQSVNLALTVVPPLQKLPGAIVTELTPRAALQPAQSWTFSYNLNLIGKDRLPTGTSLAKDLWVRAPQQPAQSWTISQNPNLIGKDRLPIRQMDWPINPGPLQPDRSTISLNLISILQPSPPPAVSAVGPMIGAYPKWRQLGGTTSPFTPGEFYVAEDGSTFYITEDGAFHYVRES